MIPLNRRLVHFLDKDLVNISLPTIPFNFGRTKNLGASQGIPSIAFTRTSTAKVTDASGTLQSVTSGTPRFDHDKDGNSLGLLIEGAATNYVVQSSDVTNAVWFAQNTTITANAAVAPDGTTTAASIIANTITGLHDAYEHNQSLITASSTRTFSCFMKKGAQDWGVLSMSAWDVGWIATLAVYAYFDLANGVIGNTLENTGTIDAHGMEYWKDGWYRCWMTVTTGAIDVTQNRISIHVANGPAGYWYAGDGTSVEIYCWQPQVEVGALMTSLVPTNATTITRAAELLTINNLNWLSPKGTILAIVKSASSSSAGAIFEFSDGSWDNRLSLFRSAANAHSIWMTNGGVAQSSIGGGTWPDNVETKTIFSWAENNLALVADGVVINTSSSASIPSVTQLNLGHNWAGSERFNGHISQIDYWPENLSIDDSRSLTL